MLTTNDLKMGGEPTPETLYISYVPQKTDNIHQEIDIICVLSWAVLLELHVFADSISKEPCQMPKTLFRNKFRIETAIFTNPY
jgi:hypothetical protein